MKKFLFIMLFLSSCAQALTLDDLQATFAKQQVVRADFIQQKQIKNMNKPLFSKGRMIVSQDKGLWWKQTSPFVMILIMRDDEMVQKVEGQPDQHISAQQNPQMFQFNALMRALVRADKSILEKNFTLNFIDLTNGNWQLKLTPISTPLDKLFAEIRLEGNHFLKHVVLMDKQGDTTEITFSHHQLTPTKLTQEEESYFE